MATKRKVSKNPSAVAPLVLDMEGKALNLNAKQLLFANIYIENKCSNAVQAAITAGYKPDTASTLLAHEGIRKYIQIKAEQLLDRAGIHQDMIIQELGSIAFSNVFDYFTDDYKIKGKKDIPLVAQKAVSNLKIRTTKRTVGEGIEEETQDIEFKMLDKLKALATLAEMAGLIKKDGDGSVNVTNNYIQDIDKFYITNVKKE